MFYNNRPQIKIGNRWSYDAWGLLLASGWELEPAQPKTAYVDIPASDGAVDITDVLAGEPRYSNRGLSFGLVFTQPESEWQQIRQNVENYCSGQRMRITLPHDTRHYLLGRVIPDSFEREPGSAVLSFTVTCDPWQYKVKPTQVVVEVPASGAIEPNLRNERRRVIPEITTDGSVAVTINNVTQTISAGTFKFTDHILEPGNNPALVQGTPGTTVTFTYQEGSL